MLLWHVTLAIWLHDGLWIPKEIPRATIHSAEQTMLHQLQLEPTPVFRVNDLSTEATALLRSIRTCQPNSRMILRQSDHVTQPRVHEQLGDQPIRWNTCVDTNGYQTFVERTAKRQRRS